LQKENSTDRNGDLVRFNAHINRLKSGLGLYEERGYPKEISYIQQVFKWIIENHEKDLKTNLEYIEKKKRRGITLDTADKENPSHQIKASIKSILVFYENYWGSVDFSIHSVPWYFKSMILDILKKVLPEKRIELVIFPESIYNLEITSLEDEVRRSFRVEITEINKAINQNCPDILFILRIPPYLILDPLANFLIFHEMGHYFIKQNFNFTEVAKSNPQIEKFFIREYIKPLAEKERNEIMRDDWVQRWLIEISCDCFSAAIGGPASLIATLEYFILSPDSPKKTHPSQSIRIRAIKNCLFSWLSPKKKSIVLVEKYFKEKISLNDSAFLELFNAVYLEIKDKTSKAGLFLLDNIIKYIEQSIKEIETDMLPIDLIPGQVNWLFNYVIAFNGAWSSYSSKSTDTNGWRDKYNEILLKILEIDRFRIEWDTENNQAEK